MARRRPPTVHGLAIINKPAGVTSHDVVNQMRKILGERRFLLPFILFSDVFARYFCISQYIRNKYAIMSLGSRAAQLRLLKRVIKI